MHIHPFIARALCQLVPESFTGWVRGFEVKFFGDDARGGLGYNLLRRRSARWLKIWPAERRTSSLWGLDRTFRMNANEVAQVLPTLGDGRHEFLFHPRNEDDSDQRALLELKRWPV